MNGTITTHLIAMSLTLGVTAWVMEPKEPEIIPQRDLISVYGEAFNDGYDAGRFAGVTIGDAEGYIRGTKEAKGVGKDSEAILRDYRNYGDILHGESEGWGNE